VKRMYLGYGLFIWAAVLLVWQAGRYMTTPQQEAVASVTQKEQRSEGRAAAETCVACHDLYSRKHMVGPHLVDIIGRPAGSLNDFSYSPAMKGSGIVWTREKLRAFLLKPMEVVPNTAMGITGIPESEVDELIDYLEHKQ
jgi:cytochrome c